MARLAELLPDHYYAYAPSIDISDPTLKDRSARRQYGVLTLSRWPILSARVFPLPKYPVVGHLVDQSCLQELIVAPHGRPIKGMASQNPLFERISGPLSCALIISGAFDHTSAAAFRLSPALG
jgi:hypothetical protein